jgi:hypothetical protein
VTLGVRQYYRKSDLKFPMIHRRKSRCVFRFATAAVKRRVMDLPKYWRNEVLDCARLADQPKGGHARGEIVLVHATHFWRVYKEYCLRLAADYRLRAGDAMAQAGHAQGQLNLHKRRGRPIPKYKSM